MGQSPQIPLQRDVAKNLAGLWVDYQLLGASAAPGDSLSVQKTIDDAMWAVVAQQRIPKFGQKVLASNVQHDTGNAAARYATARCCRRATSSSASAARRRSPASRSRGRPRLGSAAGQAIQEQATPANFAEQARDNSSDAGRRRTAARSASSRRA